MNRICKAIVSFLILMLVLATPSKTQLQLVENTWKDFRTDYPYHIQCVALSKPDGAGNRVLIVAEPPPHVTLRSLRALNPEVLQNPSVEYQRIGYDGWVADVVFVLPAISRDTLRTTLDQLNHYLYGTTYKANVLALPTRPSAGGKRRLDLKVPAGELGEWILGDLAHPPASRSTANIQGLVLFAFVLVWALRRIVRSGRTARNLAMFGISCVTLVFLWFAGPTSRDHKMLNFRSVLGGDKYTGRAILETNRSRVFFSETPGIVLWSFARQHPLDGYRIEAREFALDSDILIGAVASQTQLIILGRERTQPVDVLPPLRTETIMQLASANTDELAQSYERTEILAGKCDDKHDWAPIYLSKDLIDTEYGSLLNITDQILKSWSMHGLVRYVNFKYPDPEKFPFSTDLMSLSKTDQVTFNWNTKGVGYTTKNAAYEVFALHRTGALPVDYLSADNSELQKAEEDGYNYFASLSDPNLARVVQYAALYQIFRRFNVTTSKSSLSSGAASESAPPNAFREPLSRIVAKLSLLTDEDINRIRSAASAAGGDSSGILTKITDTMDMLRKGIRELEQTGGAEALTKLVDAMSAPRDSMKRFLTLPSSEQTDTDKLILTLVQFAQKNSQVLQLIARINLANVRNAYVLEMTRRTPTWIRTPTIVLSWPEGKEQGDLVGGHNLDARITQFRLDSSLSSGEIRVIDENGQKVILHSAADADKAPELVRFAARNEEKSASELEGILKNKLPEVQVRERTLEEALEFTAESHRPATRGYQPTDADANVGSMGWRATQDAIPQRQADLISALRSSKTRVVVVSRQENGSYLVAHEASIGVVESGDMPSAVDAAISCIKDETQGTFEVKLFLSGFEPAQGKGFAKSVEMNLSGEEFPKLTATIEGEPIAPEELSRLLKTDYRLENGKITKLVATDSRTVDAELTVPAVEVVRPSLIVRIKLFFRAGFEVTAEVLTSIQTTIESWQRSLLSLPEKVDMFFATRSLLRDLKTVHPEIRDIDVIYSRERKDLFYGARNRDLERIDRASGQPV
jgi:hypothetical protein